MSQDLKSQNHILSALAWIGDQKVVSLFNEWHNNPPSWKANLFIPPEECSLEAGWELTADGHRNNLFYNDCYAIERAMPSKKEPVYFLIEHEEMCKWCGNPLTVLFDFDLSCPAFQFLQLSGSRLRIATCHLCTCYGVIYTEFDGNGLSKWSDLNKKPDYLPDMESEEKVVPSNSLRLSSEKRSCYHAASQFLETTFSQIGGHPTWIQNAEYPKCPKCLQRMKFIGQIDWEDVEEYGEGIYYAFLCTKCNVAATHYQQT